MDNAHTLCPTSRSQLGRRCPSAVAEEFPVWPLCLAVLPIHQQQVAAPSKVRQLRQKRVSQGAIDGEHYPLAAAGEAKQCHAAWIDTLHGLYRNRTQR